MSTLQQICGLGLYSFSSQFRERCRGGLSPRTSLPSCKHRQPRFSSGGESLALLCDSGVW
ncbi:hypothetical protein YC2023_036304 [Brassica napus]